MIIIQPETIFTSYNTTIVRADLYFIDTPFKNLVLTMDKV